MLTATDIAWSIVIPALIGIVIGIVCWQPWRRGRAKAWAAPLGMGIGFFIAFPAIANSGKWHWPAIIPHEGTEWLPWIALGATIFALFSLSIPAPRWVWAIIVLIAAMAGCGGVLSHQFQNGWSASHGVMILLAFGIAAVIWWTTLEAVSEQEPISSSILHWLIAVCAALTLMLTGCQTHGLVTLPLAAAAGAVGVLAIWRRQKVRLNGMPMVFSIVVISTLAAGYYLSDLTLPLLLMVLGAPVLAGVSLLLPSRMRVWQRMAVGIVLTGILLGTAVGMAAREFARQQQETGSFEE